MSAPFTTGISELMRGIAGLTSGSRQEATDVGQIAAGASEQLPEEQVNQTATPPSLFGKQPTAGIAQRVNPQVHQEKLDNLERAAEDIRKRDPNLYLKMLPEIEKMRLNYRQQLEQSKTTESMQEQGKNLQIPENQIGALASLPLAERAPAWLKLVEEYTGASARIEGAEVGKATPAALAAQEKLGNLQINLGAKEETAKEQAKVNVDYDPRNIAKHAEAEALLMDKDPVKLTEYIDKTQRAATLFEAAIQKNYIDILDPRTGQLKKNLPPDMMPRVIEYQHQKDMVETEFQLAATSLLHLRKIMPGAESSIQVSPSVEKELSADNTALLEEAMKKTSFPSLIEKIGGYLMDITKQLPASTWQAIEMMIPAPITGYEKVLAPQVQKGISAVFEKPAGSDDVRKSVNALTAKFFFGRKEQKFHRVEIQNAIDDAKQLVRTNAAAQGKTVDDATLEPLNWLMEQAEKNGRVQ